MSGVWDPWTTAVVPPWTTAAAPRKQPEPAARELASGERSSGERDARRQKGGEGRSDGGHRRERSDGVMKQRKQVKQRERAAARTPRAHKMIPVPTGPIGGFIFICNRHTIDENFSRRVFGLVARWADAVKVIKPGLPLFLFNYSTKEMHGGFIAASDGALNIDPDAWLMASFGNKPKSRRRKNHRTSPFPAQVRFSRAHSYKPLGLSKIPTAALAISCGHNGKAHFEQVLSPNQCEALLTAFRTQQVLMPPPSHLRAPPLPPSPLPPPRAAVAAVAVKDGPNDASNSDWSWAPAMKSVLSPRY